MVYNHRSRQVEEKEDEGKKARRGWGWEGKKEAKTEIQNVCFSCDFLTLDGSHNP